MRNVLGLVTWITLAAMGAAATGVRRQRHQERNP